MIDIINHTNIEKYTNQIILIVEILKTKALEEGLPYQTLVTSILHKYVTGKMIESNKQNFV